MIGRLQTAVEYIGESSSPWGELKLIAGTANPELAGHISDVLGIPLTSARLRRFADGERSEEHTSELQSPVHLVCRLLLEKKKKKKKSRTVLSKKTTKQSPT